MITLVTGRYDMTSFFVKYTLRTLCWRIKLIPALWAGKMSHLNNWYHGDCNCNNNSDVNLRSHLSSVVVEVVSIMLLCKKHKDNFVFHTVLSTTMKFNNLHWILASKYWNVNTNLGYPACNHSHFVARHPSEPIMISGIRLVNVFIVVIVIVYFLLYYLHTSC